MDSRRLGGVLPMLMVVALVASCTGGGTSSNNDTGQAETGTGSDQSNAGRRGFLVFPDLTIRTTTQGPPSSGLYLEGAIVPGERLGGGDGFMPQGNILGTGTLTPGGRDFLTFPSLRIVPEQAGEEILTPNVRGSRQGEGFSPTTRQISY